MIQIVFIAVLAIIAVGVIVFLRKNEPSGCNGSGGGSASEEHEKGDGHEKVDDEDHDQDRMQD